MKSCAVGCFQYLIPVLNFRLTIGGKRNNLFEPPPPGSLLRHRYPVALDLLLESSQERFSPAAGQVDGLVDLFRPGTAYQRLAAGYRNPQMDLDLLSGLLHHRRQRFESNEILLQSLELVLNLTSLVRSNTAVSCCNNDGWHKASL